MAGGSGPELNTKGSFVMATSISTSSETYNKADNEVHKTHAITAREMSKFDHVDDGGDDLDYHAHMRSQRTKGPTTMDDDDDDEPTPFDRREMRRMGKQGELRRNFRPLSTLAFTVILQGTWEVLLTATYQGLVDGGLAGLIWSYVWTFLGFSFVMASLAEMASMAPTSGGQYHWVSEFAPSSCQKSLSYFTGWMSMLSWQAGTASGPYLVGTLIQSMIYERDNSYGFSNWQSTMFIWAISLLVYGCNVWGGRAMPVFQNLMLILHVFGFLTIVVMIFVLAPRNPSHVVFFRFTNDGGWKSMGLSLMVGQISAIYACICSDSAAHMSEEIKDAGKTVPRSMFAAYFLNGLLGMIFLVAFVYSLIDLEGALNDPTGYPHFFVFRNAFGTATSLVLSTIVTTLIFAGTLSYALSTSRQTWAFARDHGLPFSRLIAQVNPKLEVPANAVALTTAFTIVLSLINLGSNAAFNAIISLNVVSLMITYQISIGCVLYRRIVHPELLPKCRWSLGRWGILINTGGFLYSSYAFFWCFWPNVTLNSKNWQGNFNWAVVMFVATCFICLVDWFVRARKAYRGPVVLVEGWRGE